jgi:hypothetical protein
VNKASLEYFKDCEKPRIKQNLEGLLYDLDLLPEQLNREIDGKRYSAIVNLLEYIELLKCCSNCKHSVSMSEIGINYVRPCFDCENNNKWELEEIK